MADSRVFREKMTFFVSFLFFWGCFWLVDRVGENRLFGVICWCVGVGPVGGSDVCYKGMVLILKGVAIFTRSMIYCSCLELELPFRFKSKLLLTSEL